MQENEMKSREAQDREKLQLLDTEQRNPASMEIDRMSTLDMVTMINQEDHRCAEAVRQVLPEIARSVELICEQLRKGGRLFYVGAGTSGRLGVLDAAECPPTYGVPPEMVIGLIAGGSGALLKAVEGAEDSPELGRQDLIDHGFSAGDALVGIAASGRTPYVIGAMDYRFKMNNRPFRFTAEAYYKALSNLIPYSVNNVKVVYYGTNEASGHAMGLDLKLYGEFVPGTDSWLCLSVMDTKMKLNGKSVPMPTDQRYSINLFFTDYFPGTTRWKMSLKLAFADGLPFSAPHRGIENNTFRAPAYKRADIGMSFRALDNEKRQKKTIFKNIWLGIDCLNLFGVDNVNSYYWITDVSNQQYAVPNYLTGRQINGRVLLEF